MTLERWILASLIVVVAAIQYGLAIYALRDLSLRPSVRYNNKVGWGLLILAVPFVGALIYAIAGPTSFLPRPNRPPRAGITRLDEEDLL